MRIIGLQKLTLLDYPGHTACTIFTPGCNLRCPFCHNGGVVLPESDTQYKSEEEILAFLKKRQGILDGMAITGGEPLLQSDIKDFIIKVRALGFKIKLDTNGAYPDRLKALLDEGLIDYVAMDIKNSKEKYADTTGVPGLDITPFEQSVEIIKSSGIDYEFRTTVVKEFHTTDDITAIAHWLEKPKHYFLQAYHDSDNMLSYDCHGVTEEELRAMADAARAITECCETRGI